MSRNSILEKLSNDESKALIKRDRAHKAKQLMENELLKEAFEGVRVGLLNLIEETPISSNVDSLRHSLKLLKQIQVALQKHMEDGKVADKELEYIINRRKELGLFERLRKVA